MPSASTKYSLTTCDAQRGARACRDAADCVPCLTCWQRAWTKSQLHPVRFTSLRPLRGQNYVKCQQYKRNVNDPARACRASLGWSDNALPAVPWTVGGGLLSTTAWSTCALRPARWAQLCLCSSCCGRTACSVACMHACAGGGWRVRAFGGGRGRRATTSTNAFEREHMSLSASICPCVVRVEKTRLPVLRYISLARLAVGGSPGGEKRGFMAR